MLVFIEVETCSNRKHRNGQLKLINSYIGQGDPTDLTLDGQLQHGTGLGLVPGEPELEVRLDCLFMFGVLTCSDGKHKSDQFN